MERKGISLNAQECIVYGCYGLDSRTLKISSFLCHNKTGNFDQNQPPTTKTKVADSNHGTDNRLRRVIVFLCEVKAC